MSFPVDGTWIASEFPQRTAPPHRSSVSTNGSSRNPQQNSENFQSSSSSFSSPQVADCFPDAAYVGATENGTWLISHGGRDTSKATDTTTILSSAIRVACLVAHHEDDDDDESDQSPKDGNISAPKQQQKEKNSGKLNRKWTEFPVVLVGADSSSSASSSSSSSSVPFEGVSHHAGTVIRNPHFCDLASVNEALTKFSARLFSTNTSSFLSSTSCSSSTQQENNNNNNGDEDDEEQDHAARNEDAMNPASVLKNNRDLLLAQLRSHLLFVHGGIVLGSTLLENHTCSLVDSVVDYIPPPSTSTTPTTTQLSNNYAAAAASAGASTKKAKPTNARFQSPKSIFELSSALHKFDFNTATWKRMENNSSGSGEAPQMIGHALSSTLTGDLMMSMSSPASSSPNCFQLFACGATFFELPQRAKKQLGGAGRKSPTQTVGVDESGNVVQFSGSDRKKLVATAIKKMTGKIRQRNDDDDDDEHGNDLNDEETGFIGDAEDRKDQESLLAYNNRAKKTKQGQTLEEFLEEKINAGKRLNTNSSSFRFGCFLYTSRGGNRGGWQELDIAGDDQFKKTLLNNPKCNFACSRLDSLAVFPAEGTGGGRGSAGGGTSDSQQQQQDSQQPATTFPSQEYFYIVGGQPVDMFWVKQKFQRRKSRPDDPFDMTREASVASDGCSSSIFPSAYELRVFSNDGIVIARSIQFGFGFLPSSSSSLSLSSSSLKSQQNKTQQPLLAQVRSLVGKNRHHLIQRQLEKIAKLEQERKLRISEEHDYMRGLSKCRVFCHVPLLSLEPILPWGLHVCDGKSFSLADLIALTKKSAPRGETTNNKSTSNSTRNQNKIDGAVGEEEDDDDDDDEEINQESGDEAAFARAENEAKQKQSEQEQKADDVPFDGLFFDQQQQQQQQHVELAGYDDANDDPNLRQRICGIRRRDWDRTPILFLLSTSGSLLITFVVNGGASTVNGDETLDIPLISLPLFVAGGSASSSFSALSSSTSSSSSTSLSSKENTKKVSAEIIIGGGDNSSAATNTSSTNRRIRRLLPLVDSALHQEGKFFTHLLSDLRRRIVSFPFPATDFSLHCRQRTIAVAKKISETVRKGATRKVVRFSVGLDQIVEEVRARTGMAHEKECLISKILANCSLDEDHDGENGSDIEAKKNENDDNDDEHQQQEQQAPKSSTNKSNCNQNKKKVVETDVRDVPSFHYGSLHDGHIVMKELLLVQQRFCQGLATNNENGDDDGDAQEGQLRLQQQAAVLAAAAEFFLAEYDRRHHPPMMLQMFASVQAKTGNVELACLPCLPEQLNIALDM